MPLVVALTVSALAAAVGCEDRPGRESAPMEAASSLQKEAPSRTASSDERAPPRPSDSVTNELERNVTAAAAENSGDAGMPTTRAEARERARQVLRTGCGECHTQGLTTALPKALAVFDVTEPDWAAHMSDRQLEEAGRRLESKVAPTRGPEEMRTVDVSDEDLRAFQEFVAMERTCRIARGDGC